MGNGYEYNRYFYRFIKVHMYRTCIHEFEKGVLCLIMLQLIIIITDLEKNWSISDKLDVSLKKDHQNSIKKQWNNGIVMNRYSLSDIANELLFPE